MAGIDFADHEGLRGLMSLWIVVFHVVIRLSRPLDTQGSAWMPMFFLLSGFSLAVGYSDRLLSEDAEKRMGYAQFVCNRLLRVLPVYYLASLVAVPAILAGCGVFAPHTQKLLLSALTTALPVSSWLGFALGPPLSPPAWTVQTLIAHWLLLPRCLRYLHGQSDAALLRLIRRLFWLQAALLAVLFVAGLRASKVVLFAFSLSTMQPLSRLPVFLMGAAAGVLALRHREQQSMPWFAESEASAFFPSLSLSLSLSPPRDADAEKKKNDDADSEHKEIAVHALTGDDFLRVLFAQTRSLSLALFAAFALDSFARIVLRKPAGVLCFVWVQGVVCFSQLQIVLSLTRHGSPQNALSRFLRLPAMQTLGRLSMSVYLLHMPVGFWLHWLLREREIFWPAVMHCDTLTDSDEIAACARDVALHKESAVWPLSRALLLPICAVACAFLTHRYVEKPMNALKY